MCCRSASRAPRRVRGGRTGALFLVLPAKAGIQASIARAAETWVPAFAGTTGKAARRLPKSIFTAYFPVCRAAGCVAPLSVSTGDWCLVDRAEVGCSRSFPASGGDGLLVVYARPTPIFA